ncbi:uncharacterized protein RAG0_03112 [Rhynchosporium agropyri]|uniref:Uncharacterized protein n=1 Tax=Rhynchosporium agropyri TaxID=914238 RepID=A0A1E1K7D2_9HELO|nr:uncharacterized protein RAG0_03112 [Rhynchosporium agropyri]
MPRTQRTTGSKEKKLNDRIAKLAEDAQRKDGTSIKDTDLQTYVNLLATATARFKDFIRLVGPDDPRVHVKDPERYFDVDAQHLSLGLVKLFTIYLARTSAGRLDDRIISSTVRGYISHTLCAIYRSSGGRKQLDAVDMSQVHAYINQLQCEGELSSRIRVKPVATKNDLDILIAIISSDAYAFRLTGVRPILILALYINLYVDACGRGSDPAWGGPTVVEQPNHCLCWDHCEFYVVCLGDGDRVITANITLEYQKGQRASGEKMIVTLRLLPTAMAMQDSLRLLLTLAIIDGVFGVRVTWADLLAVDPAGFQHNATPYSLRRAYANVLYANVSAEDRKFLMGHKTNSDIYSHYHSAVSMVNVQEIFQHVRASCTGEMHGLSLNRVKDMPQNISEEGWQKVQQDPEVVKEAREITQTTSELRGLYGSVSAAVRACDIRIEELLEETARLKNRRRALYGIIYREEYRMVFVGRSPQQPAELHISGDDDQENTFIQEPQDTPGGQDVLPRDDGDVMDAVRSSSYPKASAEESIHAYYYPEPPSISVADTTQDDASGWILQVAREEEAVLSLDDRDIIDTVDSCGDGHDEPTGDQVPWMADVNDLNPSGQPNMSASLDLLEEPASIRSHGINDGKATPKNMSISRFRDAASSGGYTDAALSDLIVEIFSALHRSGNFIPGDEPLLGTYTCRFSGIDLSTRSHAAEVAHSAQAKLLKQAAMDAFEQHFQPIDSPGSFYTQGPLQKTNPKLCGFNSFKTCRDQTRHVFQHTLVMHKKNHAVGNIPHGEWHCYFNGCAISKPPTTSTAKVTLPTSSTSVSEKGYLCHVYHKHRLSPLSTTSVSWCGICEQFLEWEQLWI